MSNYKITLEVPDWVAKRTSAEARKLGVTLQQLCVMKLAKPYEDEKPKGEQAIEEMMQKLFHGKNPL